jgi:hypothetical protein
VVYAVQTFAARQCGQYAALNPHPQRTPLGAKRKLHPPEVRSVGH